LRRLIVQLVVFGVGVFSVQVLTALAFGFEPVRSFTVMLGRTRGVNVARNYWLSLVYTPYDILLFAGIPVAVLLVGRVVWMVRAARRGHRWEQLKAIDWLLVATLATLGLAMLTGVERSENARTYLFLIPVIALFGAAESERLGLEKWSFTWIATLTFLQLMIFQAVLEMFL
jgi:hypothetical protein